MAEHRAFRILQPRVVRQRAKGPFGIVQNAFPICKNRFHRLPPNKNFKFFLYPAGLRHKPFQMGERGASCSVLSPFFWLGMIFSARVALQLLFMIGCPGRCGSPSQTKQPPFQILPGFCPERFPGFPAFLLPFSRRIKQGQLLLNGILSVTHQVGTGNGQHSNRRCYFPAVQDNRQRTFIEDPGEDGFGPF